MSIPIQALVPALVTASLLSQSGPPGSLPAGAPAAMRHIDREDLMVHAAYLSGDELGGRLTGSPGLLAAARYIAAQFDELGLEPLGDQPEGQPRAWLQTWPISRTFWDGGGLTFGETRVESGFAVLHQGGALHLELEGQWRFLGAGRTRGQNAEVPAGTDLSSTLPLILLETPPAAQGIEQQMMLASAALARVKLTVSRLARSGARAVAVLSLDPDSGLGEMLNYMAVSPGKALLEPRATLRPLVEGGLSDMGRVLASEIPTVFLSARASLQALELTGVDKEALARYRNSHSAADLPQGEAVPGRLDLGIRVDDRAEGINVIGVLRGGDPVLAKEAVVFSAHMDHVGRRLDGDVFNGADDNASGTAGLIEIAQAFSNSATPARSVIFLAVSGEELGLWGSAYFAAHPPWDPDLIAADVNTDMIGRSGPDSGPDEVAITPSYRNQAFSTMVRDAARFAGLLGLGLRNGDRWYDRSDHFNFVRLGIPVVFFCDGEHEDYHQVTDHADKLDGSKMERIARLAFWTGYRVANAAERPHRLGTRRGWDRRP